MKLTPEIVEIIKASGGSITTYQEYLRSIGKKNRQLNKPKIDNIKPLKIKGFKNV